MRCYAVGMFRSLLVLELLLAGVALGGSHVPGGSAAQDVRSAIVRGDLPSLERFVKAGVALNEADTAGATPLAVAILAQRKPVVEYLLSHGADPNLRKGQTGATALSYAVAENRPDLVQMLIANKANPNLPYADGQNLLHLAVRHGGAAMVRLLCTAGVDKEATDANGNTPLDQAVLRGNTSVAVALLQCGADPGRVRVSDGRGPLHQACIKGTAELIPLLVAAGANVVAEDRSGQTPLDLALDYGNLEAVKRFFELSKTSKSLQANFASAFGSAAVRGRTARVALLLDAGLRADARTTSGSHSLNDAALKGRLEVVRLLLDRGASPELRNEAGGTVLHDAATAGDRLVIALLLDRGAAIDAREIQTGATPLMLAASMGRAQAVSLLLARGADRSLTDKAGRTALAYAREFGDGATLRAFEKQPLPAALPSF